MDKALFETMRIMQRSTDELIKANHSVNPNSLLKQKSIALEVELSEFANEVRFFKFWSNKLSNQDKALTEYVDALHFMLSIANDLGIEYEGIMEEIADEKETDIESAYYWTKKWSLNIYINPDPVFVWTVAFSWFWVLGEIAGFTQLDIYYRYLEKNSINHQRQAQGY